MDFLDFDKDKEQLEQTYSELEKNKGELAEKQLENSQRLDDLLNKVNAIRENLGLEQLEYNNDTATSDLDMYIENIFPFNDKKNISNNSMKMQPMD